MIVLIGICVVGEVGGLQQKRQIKGKNLARGMHTLLGIQLIVP